MDSKGIYGRCQFATLGALELWHRPLSLSALCSDDEIRWPDVE
jgi:hypothetical protein